MTTRSGVALPLAVGGMLLSAGAAYAYWTADGTGGGAALTGSVSSALVLSPGTPTGALYPGGSSAVVLTVRNANGVGVHIGTLHLDTTQGSAGYAVDGAHATCDVAVLHYSDQTNGGAGWSVPAATGGNDGTLAVTLAGALAMDADAASSCQGATFTVYLAALA